MTNRKKRTKKITLRTRTKASNHQCKLLILVLNLIMLPTWMHYGLIFYALVLTIINRCYASCSMYMGAEDCNNKSQCMKKALKSTWMDNFKASFKKYTSHTCGDSGNNYSTEYSGMRKCIKSCAKDENCMGLEIVPINNQYKCTKYTEIPSQSKVNPTNRKYRCYTKDNWFTGGKWLYWY